MSEVPELDLQAYSIAITRVVDQAGAFVVAVKAAAYRVTSGVVIAEDLIAVNSHSLRREGNIPVHFPGGDSADTTILGRDPSLDVAILQVPGGKLPFSKPEDTSTQRAGALAVVVGRTLDAGLSASVGILGAVGGSRRTWRGGELDRFLRLDVNLYPSQAGAAVVSARGLLYGMATAAILRHSALAVPHETLTRIAHELRTQGGIRQGYLGVGLQPVSIPEHLRSKSSLAETSGLIVLSVEPGTAADEAGLQLGDILIAAGSLALTDTETLMGALRGDAVGKPLTFTVLRAGEIATIDVQVAARPKRS